MSTRSCLCRRSLVAALAVLIFAPSVPALGSAPVRVVLQSARIELEDEDPVVGVVVRDRREGDPALLGGVTEAGSPQVAVVTAGPGPATVLPKLVLAALRDAGLPASIGQIDGPLLEVLVDRLSASGDGPYAAHVETTVVFRSARDRTAEASWTIETSGSSDAGLPEGPQAAVDEALAELEAALQQVVGSEEFGDLVDADAEAGYWVDPEEDLEGLDDGYRPRADLHGPGMRRVAGFGLAARFGVESIPSRGITEAQGEPLTLELRFVPAPFLSIDLLVDIVTPLIDVADTQRGRPSPIDVSTALLLHLDPTPSRRVSLAFAPGIAVHVFTDRDPEDSAHLVYGTLRLGADFTPPGREFGLGVYLRPAVGNVLKHPEQGTRVEVYLEVAWTIFAGFPG